MGEVIIKAEHIGILKLGDYELPCCVLDNKKRVLIQREVVYLLTGTRKGNLPRYINAQGVQQFMPAHMRGEQHGKSVLKFYAGSQIAHGYEAKDIIDICEGYLKAREAGTLNMKTQGHLALQSELIIRACAKVGIDALIDEATGYQDVRDADELQIKLKAYITEDLRQWTKTFPEEFFLQCYRLEGIEPPLRRKSYPKRFGRYIMRFVYDTMDKEIADWLRVNNPNPQGERHHHQWLTEDFGYPRLVRHLMTIIGIQRASTTMENFKENLYRAYPMARSQRNKRLAEARKERSGEKDVKQGEFTFI
jgi:P63C domain